MNPVTKHHNLLPLLFAVMAVTSLSGCDLYGQDDYVEQYMVESYLIANNEMPEIRLSTTAPFNENYFFDERAVSNADIRVMSYDEEGNHDKTYHYSETGRGIYRPLSDDRSDLVQPRWTYELDIVIPDDNEHRIEARTSVPDTFSVKEVIRDSAVYQGSEQLEFRITRNRANDRQNYFIYATRALDPVEANLTPFWRDIFEDEDIEEARRIRTSIVNEENFDLNPDGTLTLRMPWIGIAFYGPNVISTFSIDDNTFDYFRSQTVQVGGGNSTLAPGEIQNIIYNLDGAIGLFGSMSELQMEVYVERPPSH